MDVRLDQAKLPLSLVISTRNAGGVLADCIDSCRGWVSEIVVVDMESEDDTLSVAELYGAKVVQVPNAGWAEPGRQSGLDAASQPWILVLDADERASGGLQEVVRDAIARDDVDGVRVPRRNVQFGRFDRNSGIWPDWQLRLFRKECASWPAVYTHTGAVVEGRIVSAPAREECAILHESFRSIHDWMVAANRYTDHEADRLTRQGERPTLRRLFAVPAWHFAFHYVRQGGWRSGRYGLTIALLALVYRVLGELKLWERQSLHGERPGP
jgi:glycosyltransferase involved in cell wall biosynthesis